METNGGDVREFLGFQTHRDHFAIDLDESAIEAHY